MHKPIMTALSVVLIILFGINSAQAKDELITEVRLATWRTVPYLDPAYTTIIEASQVFDALFQGLVDIENDKIVGANAKDWSISKDGRIYTFNLRDDIFWSDGQPITAQDYQLAFRRLLDSSLDRASRPTYMLYNIKNAKEIVGNKAPLEELGVRAVDDKTLEIELSSPASYFMDILTFPAFVPVPSHVIAKHGNDWWQSSTMVTNGVYSLVKSQEGEHIILKKRDKSAYPDAPDIAHMIYTRDSDIAIRRLINNELDIAYDIRKSDVAWVKDRIGFTLEKVALPATVYTVFNTANEKLADKRVRQALYLSMDRDAISKATNTNATTTFAAAGMLKGAEEGLHNPFAEMSRSERIAKAKALLAEAGYTKEKPLKLTILKVSRQVLGNTALALRSMFSQIGVHAELEEVEGKVHSRRLTEKEFEVSTSSWMADFNDAMTFYGILETGVEKNYSSFNNPDYDKLIGQALSERDSLKRRKLYVQMENLLRQEVPIVPITHSGVMIVSAPTIASTGLVPVDIDNSSDTQKFLISIYNIKLNRGE